MKIHTSQLLALCVFSPNVWGSAAFVNPAPKPYTGLTSVASAPYNPNQGIPQAMENVQQGADLQFERNIDELPPYTRVQGGALRTWSFSKAERLVVKMISDDSSLDAEGRMHVEGRVLSAKIDLCEGPNRTPLSMNVYSGKGKYRPFRACIETPGASTLFIRNQETVEFPFIASVAGAADNPNDAEGTGDLMPLSRSIYEMREPRILQGNSVYSYPLGPEVQSVKVILQTPEGRPLNAMIELVQGPNAPKHTTELYTEDGIELPFFMVIDTPGQGNMVRIVNTNPPEFPLLLYVEPFRID